MKVGRGGLGLGQVWIRGHGYRALFGLTENADSRFPFGSATDSHQRVSMGNAQVSKHACISFDY